MKTNRGALAALALLVMAGCVHANAVMLDPTMRYPAVHPDEVRVFLHEDRVPWEYEEIALIHAKGDDDWTNEAELVEAIRERAAEVGAEAVILSWIDEPSVGERIADAILDEDVAQRRGRAIAIRRLGGR